MRTLASILLFLIIIGGGSVVVADEAERDRLFEQLLDAPDEVTARQIEDQIWLSWFRSGNRDVDALMETAMSRRGVYDFAGALEALDRVSALMPEYAEAWNQRATIHFYREEYEQSLEAVARTLELEPRHFGAMAGRVVIRLRQLKPALARQNLLEALKINPWLREKALFPGIDDAR